MLWYEDEDTISNTRFSSDQCRKIAEDIRNYVGLEWFEEQLEQPARYAHPLINRWRQIDEATILEFITFASDLGQFSDLDNFDKLVKDLKEKDKYKASRHEAHTAAFFKRGGVKELSLFQKADGNRPDIYFEIGGNQYFVECKIFEESEKHTQFTDYFKRIFDICYQFMKETGNFTSIEVRLSRNITEELYRSILDDTKELIENYRGNRILSRGSYQIEIQDVERITRNMPHKEGGQLYAKSPIDPSEYKRIRNTVGKARQQLPDQGYNLISLEIPHYSFQTLDNIVSTIVQRDFEQEWNKHISGAILYKRAAYPWLGEYRHIDFISILRNPNGNNPIKRAEISKYIEESDLIDFLPRAQSIPYYQIGLAQGQYKKMEGGIFYHKFPLIS